jgi:hypothetical protein
MSSRSISVLANLVLASVATTPRAQFLEYGAAPPHSRAAVNDPRSHGVVGDRLLSIAEAILLTNKFLDEASLSREERAQLSGFGGDIAWAEIDATLVPRITLERNLPVIIDTPHGFTVAGSNGTPVIDLGDTQGFVAISDFVDFANLELRGGEYAIQITQLDTLFGSLIDRVRCEGQTSGGVKLELLRPAGASRLLMDRCTLRGVRSGLTIRDTGDDRTGIFDLSDCRFVDCEAGIDIELGSRGFHVLGLSKVEITGSMNALAVTRRGTPGPGRGFTLDGRYMTLIASGNALVVQGDNSSPSRLMLEAVDVIGTGQAVSVGALGSLVDLTLRDSRLSGSLHLAGSNTGKFLLQNAHIRNAGVRLESTGASNEVLGSVLENTTMTTGGTASVLVLDSRFVGGSIAGTSSAPLRVISSHLNGTSVLSGATVSQPLSDPQLGTFDASPLSPLVGGTLTLRTDLPSRLLGYYFFGDVSNVPSTFPGGLRVYCDPAQAVLLPGAVSATQTIAIPIPSLPGLKGRELFFHLAVVPSGGLNAPGLWLPPGRRVVIQ